MPTRSRLLHLATVCALLALALPVFGQTTYTWNVAGNGSWATAANWTPTRSTPAANDILVFNNGLTMTISNVPTQTVGRLLIQGNSNVTLSAGGGTQTLTIGNGTGADLLVSSGSTLTQNVSLNNIVLAANATADISGTFVINGSYSLANAGVVSTVSGTLNNANTVTGGSATKLVFTATGIYVHNQNGGTIPTATWNTGSDCNVTGIVGSAPGGLGQSFATFTWNNTGQTVTDLNINAITDRTIGNFVLSSTGSGSVRMVNNAAHFLTVTNFTQTGGVFHGSTGNSVFTLNVAGNFAQTGGTFTETGTSSCNVIFNGSGTQTFTSGGTLSNTVNFTVNSGATLQMAAAGTTVDGAGTFTLSSGAGLGITSAAGIAASGASGNIRVTGTRTFNAGATYIYNGPAAQSTGSGLPASVSGLTINNAGGAVTLTNSVTVTGQLTLNTILTTGANTVTVNSAASATRTAGHVNGNLKMNYGTGAGTKTFHLGDASNYTPVVLAFANVSVAGGVTGNTTGGDHPNLTTPPSTINPMKTVNRYWTLTKDGTIAFSTYNATFTWVNADQDGSFNPMTAICGKYDGTWTLPTMGTLTANSAQVTGVSTMSDFQIGNTIVCPSITATLSGDNTICAGGTSNLNVAISGGASPYAVNYSGGGGGTVTGYLSGANIPVSPAMTTTYGLVLVTDADGCTTTGTGSAQVNVNQPPACTITGTNSVCANTNGLSFSAPAGMSQYAWSISGNGTINGASNGQTVTVDAGSSGAFTLFVTVTDANTCTSTCMLPVTVNPLPTVFPVTGTGSNCEGFVIGLDGGQSGVGYQLYRDGNPLGQPVSGPTVSFGQQTATGTYTVVATNDFNCTASMSGSVIITAVGDLALTVSSPAAGANCGDTIDVNVVATTGFCCIGALQYGVLWDPGHFTYISETAANIASQAPDISVTQGLGELRYIWLDTTVNFGATLPDGTNLLRIRFKVLGCDAPAEPVRIDSLPNNNPLLPEALNCSFTPITVNVLNTAKINIIDSIPPVIACPVNLTLECGDTTNLTQIAAWLATATAMDACSGLLSLLENSYTNGSMPDVCDTLDGLPVVFTARDSCDNESECTAHVFLLDTRAPYLICPDTLRAQCSADLEFPPYATLAEFEAGSGLSGDSCGVDAQTFILLDRVANEQRCPETVTRVYQVSDFCGNTGTCVQKVVVLDTIPPALNCPPAQTVACSITNLPPYADFAAFLQAGGSAQDNCGTDADAFDVVGEVSNNQTCPETVLRSYQIADDCGNTGTCIQMITVKDTIAPTWSVTPGSLNRTLECSDAAGIAAAQSLAPVASDLCDNSLSPVKTPGAFVPGPGPCTQAGTYTNTWTVADDCGNQSAIFTQVITIIDTLPPVWTFVPANTTVECDAVPQAGTPTATDACGGQAVTIQLVGETVTAGNCANSFTVKRTWRATDACGNSTTTAQMIGVSDTQAPVWQTLAGALNVSVQCSDTAGLTAAQGLFPAAKDNCDTLVTLTKVSGPFVASQQCPAAGTYTNTWTATDNCSNTSIEFIQIITIKDTLAPVWQTAAGALDVTLQCNDAAGLSAAQNQVPQAADNCAASLMPDKVSGPFVASQQCQQAGTYTNTWTVKDDCGNLSAVFTQVITIRDTIAPTWSVTPGSLNRTLECSDAAGIAAAQSLAPVASDLCDNSLLPVKTPGVFVPGPGPCTQAGTYTNTWTVADDCGNQSAIFTQVITIIDTLPPVWTFVPANTTVECDAVPQAGTPTATDACGGMAVTINYQGQTVTPGNCTNSFTLQRTWIATDACGNAATTMQTLIVLDTQAPTWTTAAGALDVTVECSDAAGLASAQLLVPVAQDNCDTSLTPVKSAGTFVPGQCPQAGTFTNTFIVSDDCGNTSTVFTQVITVKDTQAPTWNTVAGSLDRTLECSDATGLAAAQTLAPTATDNCDQTLNPVKMPGTFAASNQCPQSGTYTNTWTVTDACGNTSTVFTQTITIKDTQAPTWLSGAHILDVTLECSDANGLAAAQLLEPVAFDLCDQQLTPAKTPGAFVPSTQCPQAGTYTNTFTATDDCGNTSTVYTQIITIKDTQPPVWTFVPANTTVECNAVPTAGTPTATDACGGTALTINYQGQTVTPGNCTNSFTLQRTWIATDACGNATTTMQTLIVLDTQAPTWTTAAGALDVTVECSDAAGLASAQLLVPVAQDNCDTSLTPVKSAGTFVPGQCPQAGTFTNTFIVSDDCGNTSTVFTQVITVKDTQAPTWNTVAGSLDRTIECSDLSSLSIAQTLAPTPTDNCDQTLEAIKVSGAFVPSNTCLQAGTYTNTWTVTDDCGNTSTVFTQTITIQDTQAPTWTTAAGALDVTLECSDANGLAAAQLQEPVAFDLCDQTLTPAKTPGAFVPSTQCPQAGTYTNTFTATDDCGNTSTVYTQIITIKDTQPPVWTFVPANTTVECNAVPTAGTPTATDACGGTAVTINYQGQTVTPGNCTNSFTLQRTWIATDACGNATTTMQTLIVLDTQAPTWTTAAGALDVTVECSDAAGLASAQLLVPVAQDNCDTSLTPVKSAGTFVPGQCPQAGTFTNTFIVSDDCGNTSTVFTQVITVKDTQAPTWNTVAGSLDRTLECSDATGLAAAQTLAPMATDNCDQTLNPVKVPGSFAASNQCPQAGTYTNTWTVTDDCGNTSMVFTQTITIKDTQAPTWLSGAHILDMTLECSDANGLAAAQQLEPVAFDLCDQTLTPAKTPGAFVPGTQCPQAGTYTNTFTATDDCGNTSTVYTQIITIKDTQPPVWTFVPANTTIECDAVPQAGTPTATDACGGTAVTINYQGQTVTPGNCTNSFTLQRTWIATDACGNATTTMQTLIVLDTQAPTWTTAAGALDVTVECSDAAGLASAQLLVPVAQDNCDTSLTPVKSAGTFVPGQCPQAGTFTNTWTVTDDCGNTSTVFTQVITVKDTQAPTWNTTVGSLDRTVECSDAAGLSNAQQLAPTAADNCDQTLSPVKVPGSFAASNQCPQAGTYTNTWTVTDDCGNTSTVFTQTITIKDTQAPTWLTQAGVLDVTLECSDANGLAAAQLLEPTPVDLCDQVLILAKTSGAFVPGTQCPQVGTYTNTWTATDDCGNTSTVYTQVITIKDTQPPAWTFVPANTTIECDAVPQAGTPTATDVCGGTAVTINYQGQTVTPGNCANSYTLTRTWVATDACGNATTTMQTLIVLDTQAPNWTTQPLALDVTVECSDAAGLAAAQLLVPVAQDNCDTSLTPVKSAGTFVPGQCPQAGTFTNTWTVTDDCGNTSTVFTQVITVKDTQAPTWNTTVGSLDRTVECSDAAGLSNAQQLAPTAADNCDQTLSPVKVPGSFAASNQCPQAGTYTNTWTVTDDCGNTSTVFTQTITIKDTQAPTWLTQAGVLDVTLECSDANGLAAAQLLEPTPVDLCDQVLIPAKTSGAFVPGTQCPQVGTYTNTWTATDDCGNTSTVYTQVITIKDTQPPAWTFVPANTTIECDAVPQAGTPTATDACGGTAVTINYQGQTVTPGNCANSYTLTRTWVATDACGNAATTMQTLIVLDTQAPTWTTQPLALDVTVECSDAAGLAAAQLLEPVAHDNCDVTLVPVKSAGTFVPGQCPQAGTFTNTWTVTDDCGNTSTVFTQVITVKDTQAPTWNTVAGSLDRTLECSDVTGLSNAQQLAPQATDNCDQTLSPVKVTGSFAASNQCPQAGTYTNTWTVTDDCGNTSTVFTQTITIKDTQAPTWLTQAGVLDVTLECSDANGLAAAQLLEPTPVDLCDQVLIPAKTSGAFVPGTQCPQVGTYTNTWTATDDCGNTSTVYTQVITIKDTQPPVWTFVPANTTIECDAVPQAGTPTATDVCGGTAVTINYQGQTVTPGNCANSYTLTRTWVATDACGNATTTMQTLIVLDTQAPNWTTAAGALDVTVECSDAAGLAAAQLLEPVAHDNCDITLVPVKSAGTFVPGQCPQAGTFTNTFVVTDDCGNTSTVFTQVITLKDTQAPTWNTVAGSLDRTLECSDVTGLSNAQQLAPQATDNCDQTLNPVKVPGSFVASNQCPQAGTYTNTWTVTDDCGNTSTVFTQTITIKDTQAPTWLTQASVLDRTVECSDQAGLAAAQSLEPVASDLCDQVLTTTKVLGVLVPGTQCPQAGTITNTFTVKDDCGNLSTVYTQTITITDTQAPVWTFVPANTTVNCEAVPQPDTPTATDACGGTAVTITYLGQGVLPGNCPNSFTLTRSWSATDACGNSTVTSQQIAVVDTQAPTWTTAAGALDVTLECSDAAGLANAQQQAPVAHDNCDITLVPVKSAGTFVPGQCLQAGTFTNTWTVTDDCGNTSTVFTQVITLKDTQAPTWNTVAGSLDRTLECSDVTGLSDAQQLAPQATDNCDEALTPIKVSGTFAASNQCPQAGTYTNNWTVTDDCGNTSTVFTQTITIQDTQAPTWLTQAGVLDRTVECSDQAGLAAAQQVQPVPSDGCDQILIPLENPGAFVPGTCPQTGTYTNTWTVTDDCGNTSTVYTQVITVTDTTDPVLNLPALNQTVECDGTGNGAELQAWLDNHGGASATDACGMVTWSHDYGNTNVLSDGCGATGSVTVTFTAADGCGNFVATTASFSIEDTTAPVFALPAADLTVECDGAGNAAEFQLWLDTHGGAQASETCSTVTWSAQQGVFSENCAQTGAVTVQFTATDACGNARTTTATFTVADTQAPTFTAPADTTVYVNANCAYDASVAATGDVSDEHDNCDTGLEATFSDGPPIPGQCPGAWTILRTWSLMDACGNAAATQLQTITVRDSTPPTLLNFPANISLTTLPTTCEALASWTPPTVTDNCQLSDTLTFTISPNVNVVVLPGTVFGIFPGGVTTVTYTATDCSGNSVHQSFTITVTDATPPIITGCPQNISVGTNTGLCSATVNWNPPTASDNCPGVTLNGTQMSGSTFPTGTTTVVYTATDVTGNSTVCSFTVTVTDTEKPLVHCHDLSVYLDGMGQATALPDSVNAGSTDNCGIKSLSLDPAAVYTCANLGANLVVLVVTDTAGNSAQCSATVTVKDTTAPTLTCPGDLTLECGNPDNSLLVMNWIAGATAADNCPGNVAISSDFTTLPAPVCTLQNGLVVTITATDGSNNTQTCTATLYLLDTQAPAITCPANLTLECGDTTNATQIAAWLATATANDACAGPLTPLNDFDIQNLPQAACSAQNGLVVHFTALDGCDHEAACSTTVYLLDTQAPAITCPANLTLECGDTTNATQIAAWLATATANDACAGPLTPLNDFDIQNLPQAACSAQDGLTVHFTVLDGCDNPAACSATIDVLDTQAPAITCPTNLTLECGDATNAMQVAAWLATATASDACSGPLTPLNDFDIQNLPQAACSVQNGLVVHFTALDGCDHEAACSTTVYLLDTQAPSITCPANLTLECGDTTNATQIVAWLATATANDACAGPLTPLNDFDIQNLPQAACSAQNGLVVHFTALDGCDHEAACSTTVYLLDTQAPVITCPADLTLECGNPDNGTLVMNWLATATASDACEGPLTPLNDFDIQNLPQAACSAQNGLVVHFTALDGCDHEAACSTTVYLLDTQAPAITCPANLTLECGDATNAMQIAAWLATATANDACAGPLTPLNDFDIQNLPQAACSAQDGLTVHFTVLDGCDNPAACTATIDVLDTQAPSIACPTDLTLECGDATNAMQVAAWLNSATATDACSGPLTPLNDFDIQNLPQAACSAQDGLIVHFTVLDGCDNPASCTATIDVLDTQAPSIACPTGLTLECGDATNATQIAAWLATATATDACSGPLTPLNDYDGESLPAAACVSGDGLLVTFTVLDGCDNPASCAATIYLLDTQAPAITCPADLTLECGNPDNGILAMNWLATATASDACEGPLTPLNDFDIQNLPQAACSAQNGLVVHFTALDGCDHEAACSTTVYLLDTQAPAITCPANLTLECGDTANHTLVLAWLATATATDACEGALTPLNDFDIQNLPQAACSAQDGLTVHFTVLDGCDNPAACSATIDVLDTQAPAITCPANLTLECGDATNAMQVAAWLATATATDACAGSVSVLNDYDGETLPASGCVSGDGLPVTFTALDGCDNPASCSATIYVLDTQAPSIACPADLTLECGNSANASQVAAWLLTATASDACEGPLTPLNDFDSMNLPQAGCTAQTGLTVTFTALDGCDHSTSCSATIYQVDTQAPEITCPENLTLECGDTTNATQIAAWLATATATDACAGILTPLNDYDGQSLPAVACLSGDGLPVTFTALDGCDHEAACSTTVYLLDTQAPVITCPANLTLECGDTTNHTLVLAWLATATATDACEGALTPLNDYDGESLPLSTCDPMNGGLEVTFTAYDGCDHSSSCSASIYVADTQAPTFTAPADITLELNADCQVNLNDAGDVTDEHDNCDTGLQATFSDAATPGPGASERVIVRTWTLTDGCDHGTTHTQTITVVDNQAPHISCPGDVSVAPNGSDCTLTVVGNEYDPQVSDNCGVDSIAYTLGGALTGAGSGSLEGVVFPIGTTVVFWTVTDINGNTAACSFSIKVTDCRRIAGQLIWEGDDTDLTGVAQAQVSLSGDGVDTDGPTPSNGTYLLTTSTGSNFVVTPVKTAPPADPLNGLNVLDALLIQQYIVGLYTFPDPYKMIAADLNMSNGITTLDASIVRQALLGNPQALNILLNKPWRFVPTPANTAFSLGYVPPANPFSAPIPSTRVLSGVSGDALGENFYGIKIGDVNATDNPLNHPVNGTPLVFRVQDLQLEAGKEVVLVFTAEQFNQLAGYQFALQFDPAYLQLLGIEPMAPALNLTEGGNFGLVNAAAGELRSLWVDPFGQSLPDGEPVFALRFHALQGGAWLHDLLHLKPKALAPEAYTPEHATGSLELRFTEPQTTGVSDPASAGEPTLLFQNRPNPFTDRTQIGFFLPDACAAQLRVLDATGRELYRLDKSYPAGYHEETLLLRDLHTTGVLYYELTTPAGHWSRKMTAVGP